MRRITSLELYSHTAPSLKYMTLNNVPLLLLNNTRPVNCASLLGNGHHFQAVTIDFSDIGVKEGSVGFVDSGE